MPGRRRPPPPREPEPPRIFDGEFDEEPNVLDELATGARVLGDLLDSVSRGVSAVSGHAERVRGIGTRLARDVARAARRGDAGRTKRR
jgi:hypothetical protein